MDSLSEYAASGTFAPAEVRSRACQLRVREMAGAAEAGKEIVSEENTKTATARTLFNRGPKRTRRNERKIDMNDRAPP
jgi:hypothetical protein